jgi:hypothetical protein
MIPTTTATAAAASRILVRELFLTAAIFRQQQQREQQGGGVVKNKNKITTRSLREENIVGRSDGGNAITITTRRRKTKMLTVTDNKNDVLLALQKRWFTLPQVSRYFVSGNMANAVLFFLEKGIRYSLSDGPILGLVSLPSPHHLDTISYFTAYLLHIVVQHGLHAILVYGVDTINTRSKYWATLWGTYQALFVSAIGSTLLNSYLISPRIGCPRDVSFVLTLVIFSCLNYVWITYVVVKQVNDTKTA